MEEVKLKYLGCYFLNLLNLKKNIFDLELIIIYLKYIKKQQHQTNKNNNENNNEINESKIENEFILFKIKIYHVDMKLFYYFIY